MENIFETLGKITNPNIGLVAVKENVEISINFEDFEPMTLNTINGIDLIFDFGQAINIARSLHIPNIQLRQDSNGGVMEWDNF